MVFKPRTQIEHQQGPTDNYKDHQYIFNRIRRLLYFLLLLHVQRTIRASSPPSEAHSRSLRFPFLVVLQVP